MQFNLRYAIIFLCFPISEFTFAQGKSFNCTFRSEVRVSSLSVTAPITDIKLISDSVVIEYAEAGQASVTDERSGLRTEMRRVGMNDSDHLVDLSRAPQISILSILGADATGKTIAIWSFHAWGDLSGALPKAFTRPAQRFGYCTKL
jgi:hypothetical protein